MKRRQPRSTLFPYTTLFRSEHDYMIRWLEAAFAENMRWDRFVREILTATGLQRDNGATTFFVTHQSVDEVTDRVRSEEHTSELQSRLHLVCRLLLEKKKKII